MSCVRNEGTTVFVIIDKLYDKRNGKQRTDTMYEDSYSSASLFCQRETKNPNDVKTSLIASHNSDKIIPTILNNACHREPTSLSSHLTCT